MIVANHPFAIRPREFGAEILTDVIHHGQPGAPLPFVPCETESDAVQAFLDYCDEHNILIDPAQTAAQLAANAYVFFQVEQWESGRAYTAGERAIFDGIQYEVVQPHTSQGHQTPPMIPAIWKLATVAGTIPIWVQPLGAHDAYQLNDEVLHDGKHWKSIINNNVWAPGVYGWVEV